MIPIYQPFLHDDCLRHAHDALDSGWISSQGKYVREAEAKLEGILGAKHVCLVNNGTAATHLVAKGLLFKHPHIKKLFVPNNVYVAAWNSFCYDNQLELVPIDADLDTWNIDIEKLKEQIEEDCAVLIVHNVGNIINVPDLKRELPESTVFVEDNCEGFMGMYNGRFSGTQSLISSLSFFGNKTITCGEGGAVVTDDTQLFDHIRKIKGQGQSEQRYVHDVLGYNYRMTNVQAAILLGQLESLDQILARKDEIFSTYRDHFSHVEGVHAQELEAGTMHSNWMMGVRIEGNQSYEYIRDFLYNKGVDSRPMFYPMSKHNHLKKFSKGQEVVASKLNKECVLLPSYPELSKSQCMTVIEAVKEYVR